MNEEAEKEQSERREYVKNIGIEYRFGCYEEKRADSCQLLAEYFEAIDKNAKAALALFKANCENRKYPKSCFKYAMYLLAGKECEPSLKKMFEPLQIACDANVPQGCRYLSLVNWNGEADREPNSELAEKYMQKACDLEDGEACWLLSTWYMGSKAKFNEAKKGGKDKEKNDIGSLERNMEKSLEYAKRACDSDIPQSCANVARMLKIGDGVPRDLDEAKKYLDKAKDIMDNIKKRDSGTGFTGVLSYESIKEAWKMTKNSLFGRHSRQFVEKVTRLEVRVSSHRNGSMFGCLFHDARDSHLTHEDCIPYDDLMDMDPRYTRIHAVLLDNKLNYLQYEFERKLLPMEYFPEFLRLLDRRFSLSLCPSVHLLLPCRDHLKLIPLHDGIYRYCRSRVKSFYIIYSGEGSSDLLREAVRSPLTAKISLRGRWPQGTTELLREFMFRPNFKSLHVRSDNGLDFNFDDVEAFVRHWARMPTSTLSFQPLQLPDFQMPPVLPEGFQFILTKSILGLTPSWAFPHALEKKTWFTGDEGDIFPISCSCPSKRCATRRRGLCGPHPVDCKSCGHFYCSCFTE